MSKASTSLDTLCIHAGQAPDPLSGAVMTPIVLATTFAQDGPGAHKGFDYGRAGNPTRAALEACLAALEGARHGVAFGSGCAATMAILLTLKAGDHVLCGDDVYGGTFRIMDKVLKQFGLASTFMDMTDPARVAEALRPNTRLVWMETPSNPMLKIFDVAAIAAVARARGVPLAVDNTFATPMLQQPLALGATLAVHSTTKYLNGHSDVVGGAVLTNDDALAEKLAFLQKSVGGVPSPFDCYLVLRGLKTLSVRMARHVESAKGLASWLEKHPKVARVRYPGLASHEGHVLAARQMRGPGGMISFDLRGSLAQASAFLRALRVFACAESLGGVESLAEHPAIMTHASLPPEARAALGIGDGLIRLSVGLEDPRDLQADLEAGFAAAAAPHPRGGGGMLPPQVDHASSPPSSFRLCRAPRRRRRVARVLELALAASRRLRQRERRAHAVGPDALRLLDGHVGAVARRRDADLAEAHDRGHGRHQYVGDGDGHVQRAPQRQGLRHRAQRERGRAAGRVADDDVGLGQGPGHGEHDDRDLGLVRRREGHLPRQRLHDHVRVQHGARPDQPAHRGRAHLGPPLVPQRAGARAEPDDGRRRRLHRDLRR